MEGWGPYFCHIMWPFINYSNVLVNLCIMCHAINRIVSQIFFLPYLHQSVYLKMEITGFIAYRLYSQTEQVHLSVTYFCPITFIFSFCIYTIILWTNILRCKLFCLHLTLVKCSSDMMCSIFPLGVAVCLAETHAVHFKCNFCDRDRICLQHGSCFLLNNIPHTFFFL